MKPPARTAKPAGGAKTTSRQPAAAAPKPAPKRAAAPKAAPKAESSRKRQVAAGPAAAPAPPRPQRQKVEPPQLDRLVAAARQSLEDDKAEDIVVLDVTGRSDFADRMVIASGLAERQIQAMAQHLEEALEKAGLKRRVRIEGLGSSDWVLIDAGDLVIHLFKPEARSNYALERMWGPESPAPERHDG